MTDVQNETESEAKRRKVADRDYIDAEGVVTSEIENAHGAMYKHVATGEVVKLGPNLAENVLRMLACFGANTWIGNTVSANTDRENGGIVDWESVREAVAKLEGGEWPSRGGDGEGPGSRLNRDALAEAMILHYEDEGHPMLATLGRDELKAKVRGKMESDQKWAMEARRTPAIAAHYITLTGKSKPAKDLLAGL